MKHSLIGDEVVRGISGGQKRRVTLARGLVGGAQIVFADEPTSGLSATDAELCVRAMVGLLSLCFSVIRPNMCLSINHPPGTYFD